MILAGCEDSTCEIIGEKIKDIYDAHPPERAEERVSKTIKGWGKAVRVILANETWTRKDHKFDLAYAGCVRFESTLLPHNSDEGKAIALDILRTQGVRNIPPFMFDRNIFKVMIQSPKEELLTRVAVLTNIGRATPEPDQKNLDEALDNFKTTVEKPRKHKFCFKKFVERSIHLLVVANSLTSSSWSTSLKSSRDYSRNMGGKTAEIMDKVIQDFMKTKVKDLWPGLDNQKAWYDLAGEKVLNSGHDPGRTLEEIAYLDLGTHSSNIDSRLGHFGLLWAFEELLKNTEFGIRAWAEEGKFLWPIDQKPLYGVYRDAAFGSRVTVQPEVGFKGRVITLTDIAAIIIGSVSKTFCDNVLTQDYMNLIGLKLNAKLWRTLTSFDYGLNKSVPKPAAFKKYCISIDLTCATDSPPREVVEDVFFGLHKGVGNKFYDKTFMRFATDLACSTRIFDSKENKPVPNVHNRGVMMGELLSSIFLNIVSFAVRSNIRSFNNFLDILRGLPDFPTESTSNDDIDKWIRVHSGGVHGDVFGLQLWLDSCHANKNDDSCQSGDDCIIFDDRNLGVAARILYLMFEMQPSERTWYASKQYGTFTEESCIKTHNGVWKYLDIIKPRMFSEFSDTKNGNTLIGHLKTITGYASYLLGHVEDRKWGVELFEKVRRLTDQIINKDRRMVQLIKKYDIPVGLPTALGGINHPVGLRDDYFISLSDENKKLVHNILSMDIGDRLIESYGLDEESDAAISGNVEGIRQEVRNLIKYIKEHEMVTLRSDFIASEVTKGNLNSKTMNVPNKVAFCARKAKMTPIITVIQRLEAGLIYRSQLAGERVVYKVISAHSGVQSNMRKIRKIPASLKEITKNDWTAKQLFDESRIIENSMYITNDELSEYMNMAFLPTLQVQWKNKKVTQANKDRIFLSQLPKNKPNEQGPPVPVVEIPTVVRGLPGDNNRKLLEALGLEACETRFPALFRKR